MSQHISAEILLYIHDPEDNEEEQIVRVFSGVPRAGDGIDYINTDGYAINAVVTNVTWFAEDCHGGPHVVIKASKRSQKEAK